MWTLGFDSTSPTVTAALLDGHRLVSQYTADSAASHSTTLLPAIESVLASVGMGVRELGLISVSAGPGSFTGVRIGTACAKGLAFAYDTPCIGVSSLEAMAYLFCDLPCFVYSSLSARHNNVFGALFKSDGNGNVIRITDDALISADKAAETVVGISDAPVYLVGDGDTLLTPHLAEATGFELSHTPESLRRPSGYGTALAGLNAFENSGSSESFRAEQLMPIYLRKSQAEREREARADEIRPKDR